MWVLIQGLRVEPQQKCWFVLAKRQFTIHSTQVNNWVPGSSFPGVGLIHLVTLHNPELSTIFMAKKELLLHERVLLLHATALKSQHIRTCSTCTYTTSESKYPFKIGGWKNITANNAVFEARCISFNSVKYCKRTKEIMCRCSLYR